MTGIKTDSSAVLPVRLDQVLHRLAHCLSQETNARHLARRLLARAWQCDDHYLIAARPDQPVPPGVTTEALAMAGQLIGGMPLDYVLGESWFLGRRYEVGPGVLIPRPDTEVLLETAWQLLLTSPVLAAGPWFDLGTGSGIIAISLALALQSGKLLDDSPAQLPPAYRLRPPQACRIWATDLSQTALTYARQNSRLHHVEPLVCWQQADLWPAGAPPAAVVLSNPPYIADSERVQLDPAVIDYEPAEALFAGDGLTVYRRIMTEAGRHIKPGGWLILEHGYQQAAVLRKLVKRYSELKFIKTVQDYGGRDRVMVIQRCQSDG
ncbi:MAG: peptide chain release factor N(5)-glutamine methyltransferase [Oscillospiraceae bacterium]|nr:peptide chain release factor N(5)-glutamine methyltransferase [Oscillospiraceae bacterium]